MADNVTLPGAGIAILTEDVGQGRQMPVSKIWTGASGSADGPVTAQNPFYVTAVSGALENGNLATLVSSFATLVARHPTLGQSPASGSMPVVLPTLTNYKTSGFTPNVTGTLIASGVGKVVSYQFANKLGAAIMQVFDSITTPTTGAAPLWQHYAAPNNQIFNGQHVSYPFYTGLWWVLSNSIDGYVPVVQSPTGSCALSITYEM